jgi:hypothetical protein
MGKHRSTPISTEADGNQIATKPCFKSPKVEVFQFRSTTVVVPPFTLLHPWQRQNDETSFSGTQVGQVVH